MKIVFVVLHYLATDDTIECVDSVLLNINTENNSSFVIVVDNGSTNDSFLVLSNKYINNERVVLLKNNENLGFSKGNNVGFIYAKKYMNADFIVLLNNDTIIKQKNFTDIIVHKFFLNKYFVLGPDIVTADGYHQNPGTKQFWGNIELILFRLKKRVRIILSYLHIDSFLFNLLRGKRKEYRIERLNGDVKNTILHGACLIFSPLYIEKFNGLYDKTFLYMEEDILKLFSDYYGFLMMYTSDLQVFHKEDVSTNLINATKESRFRIKCRRLIESSYEYSKLKRILKKNNH